MPSSSIRQRKQADDSKVLVTTIIAAIALILVLAATLMMASDPETSVVSAASTSTPPPAPRPETAAEQDNAKPTGSSVVEEPALEVGTKPGQLAPDFTLGTLGGGEARLSDYRGKVVLLNFWASWCGPCRIEFPDLKAVYEKYKDSGLEIVAVNLGESAEVAGKFADEFGLSFPILLDTNAGVARQYGTYSIPTSYFLDRQGVILGVRAGAMTESYIEDMVLKMLGES